MNLPMKKPQRFPRHFGANSLVWGENQMGRNYFKSPHHAASKT